MGLSGNRLLELYVECTRLQDKLMDYKIGPAPGSSGLNHPRSHKNISQKFILEK